MADFFIIITLYLNPILCILFTFKLVELLKQIKRGEENTQANTLWVAITLAIMVCSATWTLFFLLD